MLLSTVTIYIYIPVVDANLFDRLEQASKIPYPADSATVDRAYNMLIYNGQALVCPTRQRCRDIRSIRWVGTLRHNQRLNAMLTPTQAIRMPAQIAEVGRVSFVRKRLWI